MTMMMAQKIITTGKVKESDEDKMRGVRVKGEDRAVKVGLIRAVIDEQRCCVIPFP